MKIVYKKVNDLIPYINNSRTHSEEQINQIVASINEFGFTNPLLIDEKDKGTIIDAEVEVSQVWVVKNGLGLTKAYNNKEKAIEYVEGLNEETLKMAELK